MVKITLGARGQPSAGENSQKGQSSVTTEELEHWRAKGEKASQVWKTAGQNPSFKNIHNSSYFLNMKVIELIVENLKNRIV